MTVARLEAEMSSAELQEWKAWLLLEQGHQVLAGPPALPR